MGDCNKEYPESDSSVFFFPALRFQGNYKYSGIGCRSRSRSSIMNLGFRNLLEEAACRKA
jgi:hypothetical protein